MRGQGRWGAAALCAALLGTLFASTVVSTGAASAASPNLARDGSFEFPTVTGMFGDNYSAGSRIGPWLVSDAVVTLSKPFFQIAQPYSGNQFVSLVNAQSTDPTTAPGRICETILGVIPGNRYELDVHLASLYQQSVFKLRLAQHVIDVPVNGTQVPMPTSWHDATLTTVAHFPTATLCVSATKPTAAVTYPLVDAIRVTDLGAP